MSGAMKAAIHKIFVGNLSWTIGTHDLKLYFSKYGHIHSANVICDKSIAMSKGFGFITFSTREGYNNALNKQSHFLEGRYLKVEPAQN